MKKPLATLAQMVGNKLTNRKPVLCAVCDLYITTFAGLPVILDSKEEIVAFAHVGCCAHPQRT